LEIHFLKSIYSIYIYIFYVYYVFSYTNNLLDKGTIIDLCLNRKKIWQQLKLLMHSMPDVNEEVDLDFDILSQQEFKKKFESVIGGINCMFYCENAFLKYFLAHGGIRTFKLSIVFSH
jgi:hypothetical protein